jgi:SecD/SecF fusion protein
VKNAQVQKVSGDNSLGKYGFQIDSNKLPSTQAIENALQDRFGISRGNGQVRYNVTSVGPTFGKTVANSAIEAIIASLLVISLYIALRFEWKFAVPVLIALMHDLLITSGVYALTGRTVTASTVAALLTILGYSLYDTIIVFDRIRENIPRMPRAAFSQIVNRSMSEVLTRSIATTSCTLLPVIALLFFGGSTLKDFAFALLIGVASGAYSSIFIASPVLTHWKEREHAFQARRHRIEQDLGHVPAYASAGADIEPERVTARRTGRLTAPEGENVSAAEFEQMKRDLEIEPKPTKGRTSRLTSRLSRTDEDELTSELAGEDTNGGAKRPLPQRPRAQKQSLPQKPAPKPGTPAQATKPAATRQQPATPPPEPADEPEPELTNGAVDGEEHYSAPDVAENEGMVNAPKPKIPAKGRASRSRRHGRR